MTKLTSLMMGSDTVGNITNAEELRKLMKAASSMKNRAKTLEKVSAAEDIRIKLAARLKELEGTPEAALWKTAAPETLSLEDVNRAIKQAQWYKHTYGLAAQKTWKEIVAQGNKHPMYTKAARNLEKAPELYEKALRDEAYWTNIKDTLKPASAHSKMDDIKQMIVELEGKKRTKAEDAILLQLKNIIG